MHTLYPGMIWRKYTAWLRIRYQIVSRGVRAQVNQLLKIALQSEICYENSLQLVCWLSHPNEATWEQPVLSSGPHQGSF